MKHKGLILSMISTGGTAFNGVIEEMKKLTTRVAHVLPVSMMEEVWYGKCQETGDVLFLDSNAVGGATVAKGPRLSLKVESPNVKYTESETTELVHEPRYGVYQWVVKPKIDVRVSKLGVMLVGWGGNNGSTLTAGVIANREFSLSMMFFAHRENTVSTLGRLVLIICLFVVLVITSNYTASLTSILTVQQLTSELVFDSSRDAPIAGVLLLISTWRPSRQSIVCEVAPKGKADSAEKRRRQAEKCRLRNKSRKSEARTRMKKVIMFHIPYAKFLLLLTGVCVIHGREVFDEMSKRVKLLFLRFSVDGSLCCCVGVGGNGNVVKN
ncbi:hypothetical protein Droror1_Dr00011167 [Drosera rotundifolia]